MSVYWDVKRALEESRALSQRVERLEKMILLLSRPVDSALICDRDALERLCKELGEERDRCAESVREISAKNEDVRSEVLGEDWHFATP